MTPITGTREWSVASVNCVNGCGHRCRYCYARAAAVRRKQCPSFEAWGTSYHLVRPADVRKRRRKYPGRVMFPTSHDIEPEFLEPCLVVLRNLLVADNEVLVVTKPHLECIQTLCSRLMAWRDQILFRFTIGAISNQVLAYWEPGAPGFEERLASLGYANAWGFSTSVSAEPLLEPDRAIELYQTIEPWVSDTVWFGKLNGIRVRVPADTAPGEVARIEAGQTDAAVRRVYEALKDRTKIRWKESYKEVLGLPGASEAGLDE